MEKIIHSKKHGKFTVLIDKEDEEYFESHTWCVRTDCYDPTRHDVHTNLLINGEYRVMLLHRLLTVCPADKVVDHINHNPLDNQKENLRICTQAENSRNRRQKNS